MPTLSELPSAIRPLDRPPLSLPVALRGHVSLLLFWRVGCVHSRQALADLVALLVECVDEPLALLAVHVPTVAAERDEDRIRRAVAGLALTVLLDNEHELAAALGVSALPTLVLVDAGGEVCFVGKGEPNRARLLEAIEALLVSAGENGSAARVPFAPPAPVGSPALGPTSLCADGKRLWVGAAGHGRVYALGADDRVERVVDGVSAPAGMCVHEGRLFVSDVATHELRATELDGEELTVVLGTGRRSTDRFGGGFGSDQGLCSPAGLCVHEGAIYCAQAGAHQLWQFDPETQAASAWLGTGARLLRDGAEAAAFSEPLALAATEDELLVADAGNGAVRGVEWAHNIARTIACDIARPSAVIADGEHVLVLAAWQPALLRIPRAGGAAEERLTAADGLVEPVAMALQGERLWIADVGADCLFVLELRAAGAPLRRVDLDVVPPSSRSSASALSARVAEPIAVQEFSDVSLRVPLQTAAGVLVEHGASCEVDVVDEAAAVLAADRHTVLQAAAGHLDVVVPIAEQGEGVLRLLVRAVAGQDAPVLRYLVPVTVTANGALSAEVRLTP